MGAVTADRWTPVDAASDGTIRSSCLWLHLFGVDVSPSFQIFSVMAADLTRERQPPISAEYPSQQSAVVVTKYSSRTAAIVARF